MLITRKKKIPKTWAYYAQLTIILSIYGQFVVNAPFLLLIKKYIDNPAAIMGLISLQIYLTFIIGPLVAWTSDRIWTRFGRRKVFVASADFLKALFLLAMPFAPNLWVLIILRWLYDFFGDLAAPAQAMIYEVVPANQRGMSAGFMKAFMNIGNLVFFTLLLGRFHDVYFMGPFQIFGTASGGTLMFVLCAVLFLGAAIFEAIGIKETYPPGRKRMMDGRRPGEHVLRHFVRSVFGDVFAKDLAPLYLLLFANIMFSFSLGVFQPLLFTEQWGYDLQTFGNTIAIGVPLGIVLGLLGGWMADRYGKMLIVFWTTVGNLVINIAYTVYVYYQPDYRPSFWEIVAFGNLAYVFGAIKGVATGPLLWEYVSRNRMGGATAGIMVFNAIFRNSLGVAVGVWLLVWSIWFFPQAGYNVTATFRSELDQAALMERAQSAGLDPAELQIRPVHQPGVDGETSRRWWIHKEDDVAQDWIKEREDLQNRLASLEGKREGFFVSEQRRAELSEEMNAAHQRIQEIERLLRERSEQLEARLASALESERFPAGEQLQAARFEGTTLTLQVRTLEPLDPAHSATLRDNLRGQELQMRPVKGEDGFTRMEPQLTVTALPQDGAGLYGVELVAALDPRFLALFEAGLDAGLPPAEVFDVATALIALGVSQFSGPGYDFSLQDVETLVESTDSGAVALRFTLVPQWIADAQPIEAEAVQALFTGVHPHVVDVKATAAAQGSYQIELQLALPQSNDGPPLRYAELEPRMAALLQTTPARVQAAMAVLRKLGDTLAARPIFVTVPTYAVESGYSKREYEYFFSSQILQIGTDIFGIGILIFIIYLEKRGVLHRYGAEEDKNR